MSKGIMYCPKCAAQNSDDTKYCRACRQDLQIIAQAMEHSLPVLLASKFEGYIERTNERLRRDGIFYSFIGACLLALNVWISLTEQTSWSSKGLQFCLVGYIFGAGVWHLLAFRRSLSLIAHSQRPTSLPDTIYCPRCAESHDRGSKFCRKCGEDLKVVSQSMSRSRATYLTNKLDAFIKRKKDNALRQAIVNAYMGSICLLGGIFIPELGFLFQAGFVVLGCYMFFCAGWDMLVEKRNRQEALRDIETDTEDTDSGLSSGELDEPERAHFTTTPPPSVTEATTRSFDEIPEPLQNRKEPHT